MKNDPNPLVSLVLTTYERPELAKRAVDSMIAQTYENTEVIVIEDAGETTIHDWIKKNYGDINFIRHDQNQGLAAARNTGLDVASGKYISYLDDDDEWLPSKTEKQVEKGEYLIPDRDLGVVYCGIKDHFEFESRTAIRLPENEGLLRQEIMNKGARTLSSSCLFLRDALLNVDGYDELLPSSIDHDIWMKLAVHEYEVASIKEPLVIKRHSHNREEITSNINVRIKGTKKYTEKWRSTYKDWFGPREGDNYANQYFADVVSRITVRKAFKLKLYDSATGLVALFSYKPFNPYNVYYLIKYCLIIGGSWFLPDPVKDTIRNYL